MRGGLTRSLAVVALWLLFFSAATGTGRLWSEGPVSAEADDLPRGAVMRLGSANLRTRWPVAFVGFLPGGETVITGDRFELRYWIARDGSLEWATPLPSLPGGAISPDGTVLLSDDPRKLSVYDLETGRLLASLDPPGELGGPRSIAIANHGDVVAAAHCDGELRVWSHRGDAEVWSTKIEGGDLRAISLSPDGKLLAASAAEEVTLWDLSTRQRVHAWSHVASSLVFSPDGRTLAFDDGGGDVSIVRVEDPRAERLVLEDPTEFHGCVAYSPDGSRLAAGAADAGVTVWETLHGKVVARMGSQDASRGRVAYSPDGATIASSSGTIVRLWDVESGAERSRHWGHSDAVRDVSFTPNGERIVSCDFRTSVLVWDASTGRELDRLDGNGAIDVSRDGMRIACWHGGESLQVFEDDTGQWKGIIDAGQTRSYGGSLRFFPDGQGLLINDDGGNLDLFDIGRGTSREWVPRFHEAVTGVAFTPDGTRCILSTKDGPLACFSSKTEECEWVEESAMGAQAVTVSPDGRIVAAIHANGRVQLFSVRGGWHLGTIDPRLGPQDRMTDRGCQLAFAPNGRVLVAVDPGGVLRLYELATSGVLCSFPRETARRSCLAVASRGARAATGELDGTVLVWNLLGLDAEAGKPDLDECMRGLASGDPPTGYRAMCGLFALGPRAVERIGRDVQPSAHPLQSLDELVQELAHDDAAMREQATDALRQAGEHARESLEECLAGKPPAETRERAREILDDLDAGRIRDADGLRAIRAVWVLECLDSPDARAVLDRLAAGAPGARLTQGAASTLARMK